MNNYVVVAIEILKKKKKIVTYRLVSKSESDTLPYVSLVYYIARRRPNWQIT